MCGNEVTTKLHEGENYAILSSVKACNCKSIAEFLSSENSQLFLIPHIFAKLPNFGFWLRKILYLHTFPKKDLINNLKKFKDWSSRKCSTIEKHKMIAKIQK